MCGIAGLASFTSTVDPAVVQTMTRCLEHRGPDGDGIWTSPDEKRVLGHRRLAILDLSERGAQPMVHDGSVIAWNGEAYNFRALRAELERDGEPFQSESDTEVVLRLIDRIGLQPALNRLRGFWAFALYTGDAVHLVSGPMGRKPLYWSLRDGVLVFASELRAILKSGLVPRELDRHAVNAYLQTGAVPAPGCMVDGVRRLRPGEIVTFTETGTQTERWYGVPMPEPDRTTDESEWIVRIRDAVTTAVKRRLVSDVPVAGFLSGGVDSRLCVGLMSRELSDRIQTFSIGFDAALGVPDERKRARAAAEALGTDHHDLEVHGEVLAANMDSYIDAMDQPTVEGVNSWLVSRAVGGRARVVVSGTGGDELFLGYRSAEWAQAHKGVRSIGHAIGFGEWGRRGLPSWEGMGLGKIARGVRMLFNPGSSRLLYGWSERRNILRNRWWTEQDDPWISPRPELLAYDDLTRYLPNMLLRDLDAMSMSFGLEVRTPLLDRDLIALAHRIPPELNVQGGQGKRMLIAAFPDILGEGAGAVKKTGFEVPLGYWMRNELKDVVQDALYEGTLQKRGIFESGEVATFHELFERGQIQPRKLWALVVLELWCRRFLDR